MKYQSSHTLLGDSESAETYRMANFKDNLIRISNHNQRYLNGEHSFTMKPNQFSHLTPQEFEELHLSDMSHDEEVPKKYLESSNVTESSSKIDYSYEGVPEPTVLVSN